MSFKEGFALLVHRVWISGGLVAHGIVLSFAPSAAAGGQGDRMRTTWECNSARQSVFPSVGQGGVFHQLWYCASDFHTQHGFKTRRNARLFSGLGAV